MRSNSSLPMLVLLCVLIFIYYFGLGVYYSFGLEPSPAFEFLDVAGFRCGVVWWLRAEAKRTALTNVYCPGLLVGSGWPFMIPYHLFKTRGVRGLIPLLALFGSFVAAYVATIIVYMIVQT